MFKALTIYKMAPDFFPSMEEIEAALDPHRFVPCGASQEKSVGFVPPRNEENGALAEFVAGQRILRFAKEVKSVPRAHIVKKAQEEADRIEAESGRKPGKKETRDLLDDARLQLLPNVLARHTTAWVWIDFKASLICIDSTSQGMIDDVMTGLVNAFPGLSTSMLHTNVSPKKAMSDWILAEDPQDWPEGISLERDLELRSGDEQKSTIRFQRHNLDNAEVRKHITQGKLPVRMGLSWNGRVSFELTDALRIGKIKFLEGVFDQQSAAPSSDGFDADVALSTGELVQVLPALIKALGGENHIAYAQESSSPDAQAAKENEMAGAEN